VHIHLAHHHSLAQLEGLVLGVPLRGGVCHLQALHSVQHDEYPPGKEPRTFTSNRMVTEHYGQRDSAVRGKKKCGWLFGRQRPLSGIASLSSVKEAGSREHWAMMRLPSRVRRYRGGGFVDWSQSILVVAAAIRARNRHRGLWQGASSALCGPA
jgi:hypothetical protein